MGEQRQLFRFRLPWLSAAAAAPRPVAAPRPAAEPQPRPAAQTQAPSQPTITIPIQRPPFRPPGITPVQTIPTQAEALPQKTEPQPVSTSRGTIQIQATSQTRIAPQPQSTVQAVFKQQSPSRLASEPAGQTSSQPPSPSRRASQMQTLSPPKISAMTTQVASQPPSSTQSLSSASQEPTFKPFGVAVKPSEASAQLKEVAPITAAATETPSAPLKPEEMEERKKVAEERRKATHEEPEQKKITTKLEQVPLHKEIREDISKFVHNLVTGQPKLPADEKSVSVLTLAGENRGASFHFGSESTKNDGLAHIHRGYKINPDENPDATTDGEGSSRGIKPTDSMTKENLAPKAYVNSNTQSINNSIVFESSLNGRNPGVHLDFFNNLAESTNSSAKVEPLEPRKVKFV